MKTANATIQMARDIRELIAACGKDEHVYGQDQKRFSEQGDATWYVLENARITRNAVYVQGCDGKWFMLRQYRLGNSSMTETQIERSPNAQAKLLGLRGCDMREYQNGKTCVEAGRPLCTGCREDEIKIAISEFPAEFGLRAFPGDRFKISFTASYRSGDTLYLYTLVKRGDSWTSFCKGTASELRSQIVEVR